MRSTILIGLSLVSLAGLGEFNLAHAMGKKKKKPAEPVLATPDPFREVVLGSVGTIPFQLPNGTRVDLNLSLNDIYKTSLGATDNLRETTAPDPADPSYDACAPYIRLDAAVSSFELNLTQVGVSFGYTPAGEKQTVTDVTGTVDVRIGNITMDFQIRRCVGNRCTTVATSYANHLTAEAELGLKINFSEISAGTDLVTRTGLENVLRKIMVKGLVDLSRKPDISLLPWSAIVTDSNPNHGTFMFQAGAIHRIGPKQTFEVQAVTAASGSCKVYKPVAYGHTEEVYSEASDAVVDQTFGGQEIHVGDRVVIRRIK